MSGMHRHDGSNGLASIGAIVVVSFCFLVLAGQMIALAVRGQNEVRSSISSPIATAFARPDIVDRNGRLLASDVAMPSLYADPALVIDRDEVSETLASILPGIDTAHVRERLSDTDRRFMWIRRGISPRVAQQIHDAGLPGLSFRSELKRAYPMGRLAGHVVGFVDVDNKGLGGIERYLDDKELVEPVHGVSGVSSPPVRLSIDVGVQHAVEAELVAGMSRYRAKGAAGLVLDVNTGEVIASVSLPGVDPINPQEQLEKARIDRLTRGTFELGSIFKTVTVAMALDAGLVTPNTVLDVRAPLKEGRYAITDLHPAGRPLSVSEIFVRSSNVGAGTLALKTGIHRQQSFLTRLGLIDGLRTEMGPVAKPSSPSHWGRIESITVSYGHGIAVAPLQFAASAAALVNGGFKVTPTFLRRAGGEGDGAGRQMGERVIRARTSAQIRKMLRKNVTASFGTGRRAEVTGYRVGGKTGTAELPGRKGYRKTSVISSFFAAFPMDAPRYVVLVCLFEPQATEASGQRITAGRNAAPVAGQVISRIGPMLGVPIVSAQ